MMELFEKHGRFLDDESDWYMKEASKSWNLTQNSLPWRPELKGQANLHVFEDWCGGSVNQLRKNIHFPLYPHARTSVKKLAVSPKWKNYGLRIFGYIHPYKDGDFQFSIASDDNSEFWLSSDESPANARLLVFVGKHGSEWTAPGEFTKFRSQVSKSVHLISSRRYYFEVLHKQDEKGSDHVEVGWRLFLPRVKFEVIDSPYISLYTDESSRLMNSVSHIPLSLASHPRSQKALFHRVKHGADMLKPDPRDTFFLTPMIDPAHVLDVLPPCVYSPTYVVKDFPIARYQGLQFVYLTFVYPNDFTRLTHMESENKCFYRESPLYLKKFGFYKYMKMDEEEEEEDNGNFLFESPEDFLEDDMGDDAKPKSKEDQVIEGEKENIMSSKPSSNISEWKTVAGNGEDYGDDADDYSFQRRFRHFQEENMTDERDVADIYNEKFTVNTVDTLGGNKETVDFKETVVHGKSLSWIHSDIDRQSKNVALVPQKNKDGPLSQQSHVSIPVFPIRTKKTLSNSAHARVTQMDKSLQGSQKPQKKVYITRLHSNKVKQTQKHPKEIFPGVYLYQQNRQFNPVHLSLKLSASRSLNPIARKNLASWITNKIPWNNIMNDAVHRKEQVSNIKSVVDKKLRQHDYLQRIEEKSTTENKLPGKLQQPTREVFTQEGLELTVMPLQTETYENISSQPSSADKINMTSYLKTSEVTESQKAEAVFNAGDLSDYSYEDPELQLDWLDDSVNWQRTFSVDSIDFEQLRSDWNDLRCNVSGNLQLSETEVVDIVAQYIEKLNEKNEGMYTLLQIINVEKRRDSTRGNRYLLELELLEHGKQKVRLSEYVYLLLHSSKQESSPGTNDFVTESPENITSSWGLPTSNPILCTPVQLMWRHDVMVHFVVPVKNQARWVQQFIDDLESLYQQTKDKNFNVIIIDFDSDDMDVERALHNANLPQYQYLSRSGNFERSAGLQAGADSIEDSHTILFLCDLHIHFPLNILDDIRKHCVEGKLAYAPIVMRLNCGSSPQEPDGYWEVNGFGLFGIYKSDFDKVGGMNTEEFRERWGGEDWELLDRVLQNGLEVERLRLRNFYHYYHSKRGMWDAQVKRTPRR
ncbi:N-acetyl-beta-glucosaminyl-glycoprotein 4-beta-N-acetylgalactosaminyltransferase 1 [Protopterus annectens]|uniref:N-acetyl-beta-glucosaminyl-glycoprotein 4-beta-N-acetylgalactosaminyltransferase 1 n=1 Tax=Protopterus annectens TaxID=7888 RepID=UPI001CF97884|nr:N-acetyl-beta-glucosaminyl-glycoprotein 4-beta-N-acetylgalactosaminyltransferase 1 [Protopterus annectens]